MKEPSLEECLLPLTPELFAERFHYPPAMIRLAIECGLEAVEGRITAIHFCKWFTSHYNDFRQRAGLPPLSIGTEAMSPQEREAITVGNVLRTHADYFASRSSSVKFKEEWTKLSEEIALRSEEAA